MTVVERIDAIIQSRKISRRQLAIKAGIPPSSLQSAMERGKNISFEMIEKIAMVLGVKIDELLGISEDKETEEIQEITEANKQKKSPSNEIKDDRSEFIEILKQLTPEQVNLVLERARAFAELNQQQKKKD